jgi:hypothetical protein
MSPPASDASRIVHDLEAADLSAAGAVIDRALILRDGLEGTIDFLMMLRPNGPWQLSAADPNKDQGHPDALRTFTADTIEEAHQFLLHYNGNRNLYFAVNPVRRCRNKKAAKTDVEVLEFTLGDLDPKDDETPEAAKTRYTTALQWFTPKPMFVIDSGNGVQVLWRLAQPISLPDEVVWIKVKDKNGEEKDKATLTKAAQTIVDDVEARSRAAMVHLDTKPGTQNIDRILRLPWTINLPNKVKLKKGRKPCQSVLLAYDPSAICGLEEFDALLKLQEKPKKPKQDKPKQEQQEQLPQGARNEAELLKSIKGSAILALVQNGAPVGHRSDKFHLAVKGLKELGWSVTDITALLVKYPNGIAEKYAGRIEGEVQRSYDAPDRSPPTADGKPYCLFQAYQAPEIAQWAEQTLIRSGCELYQRGHELRRPVIEEADASHGRKTNIARLIEVTPVYLRNELTKIICWERYDRREKKNVRVAAPVEVAPIILSQVGHWSFPRIAGVITTPTLRPDGSLLIQPGFDAATGLLLVAPPPMPLIPDRPSRDNAFAALKLLEDLLTEFPFVDDVCRAVGLSGLITPVVRGAFPVAPMHVARAPIAGSGKSYLWDTAASIAIGRPMPVISAGQTEEELEKRLTAAVLTG